MPLPWCRGHTPSRPRALSRPGGAQRREGCGQPPAPHSALRAFPAGAAGPAGRGAAGPVPVAGRLRPVRDRRHPLGAHQRDRGAAVRQRRAHLPAAQPGHLPGPGGPGPPLPPPLRRVRGQHRPGRHPALVRPALGGRPGRPGRRGRPRHLHPGRRPRREPHRDPDPPHRPLVDDPGPAPGRRPQRPARGGDRLRLPPAPPRPARLVPGQGPVVQRPPPRRLPPLPGLWRLLRQPRPRPALRPPLPAPRPHHPSGRRPLPDRRRRRPRLPRPPRPRLVAPGLVPRLGSRENAGMVERRSWIPMEDGVRLAASLFLPEAEEGGGAAPVVLEALPYRKDDATASDRPEYERLCGEYGYAVARVDLRGTGSSEGLAADEYPPSEQADLCQVIGWLAGQPWSTGSVGMYGTSYSGFNSLQVAAERPPPLKAVIAIYASDDRYSDDVHYAGGALRLLDLVDYPLYMVALNALPPVPALAGPAWRERWRERVETAEPWLLRWLEEQLDGPYWRQGSLRPAYERIACPTTSGPTTPGR